MALTSPIGLYPKNVSFFYFLLRANPAAKRKLWAHFKANFNAILSRFKGR